MIKYAKSALWVLHAVTTVNDVVVIYVAARTKSVNADIVHTQSDVQNNQINEAVC